MAQDIDAILDAATRPTQEYKLCLRNDLRTKHRELEVELTEATKAAGVTMADNANARKLGEGILALQEEMDAESLHLTLQALPNGRYRELIRKHPPRQDDPVDRNHQFNVDTFLPALLKESVSAPSLNSAQWKRLLAAMADGQLLDLGAACITLNQDSHSVPFSLAASRATRVTGSE